MVSNRETGGPTTTNLVKERLQRTIWGEASSTVTKLYLDKVYENLLLRLSVYGSESSRRDHRLAKSPLSPCWHKGRWSLVFFIMQPTLWRCMACNSFTTTDQGSRSRHILNKSPHSQVNDEAFLPCLCIALSFLAAAEESYISLQRFALQKIAFTSFNLERFMISVDWFATGIKYNNS